jgi:glycerophosphoryl diester phosphodiesterase
MSHPAHEEKRSPSQKRFAVLDTVENVAPRISPPLAFAHRGARAHAPENTLDAFRLALRLGATGLESDVWITADGEPVLDHDGIVKSTLRKRPISEVNRAQLPSHIPTLAELYEVCGPEMPLSLDVKDPAAYDATVAVARNVGGAAPGNLWLCDPRWERLAEHRQRFSDVRLIDSTRLKRLTDGPERHAARLREAGIDGINMHHTDWSLGLTTLFHRFDRFAFGWDAQHERILEALQTMEIDALYCDDVELMMATVTPVPPNAQRT